MPYKFAGKKYTQDEKHPLSKKRFEAACDLIDQVQATDSEARGDEESLYTL